MDALGCQRLFERSYLRRQNRGRDDDGLAWFETRQQALGAQNNLVDLAAVENHNEHGVASLAELGAVRGSLSAGCFQFSELLLAEVETH